MRRIVVLLAATMAVTASVAGAKGSFPETIALLEKLGAKNSHKCVGC